MCSEFKEFLKGHEKRMCPATQVGVAIKAKHDKKRKRLLGELNDTVCPCVIFSYVLIDKSFSSFVK